MSKILSSNPISPNEFAKQYFSDDTSNIKTILDLYVYMDKHPEEDYWDYPIEETKDIVEGDCYPVVLVKDKSGELRWFETVPTMEA